MAIMNETQLRQIIREEIGSTRRKFDVKEFFNFSLKENKSARIAAIKADKETSEEIPSIQNDLIDVYALEGRKAAASYGPGYNVQVVTEKFDVALLAVVAAYEKALVDLQILPTNALTQDAICIIETANSAFATLKTANVPANTAVRAMRNIHIIATEKMLETLVNEVYRVYNPSALPM